MEDSSYFFDLSRVECEDILHNKKNGTFLIRRSESNRENFVLVVNWDGKAHHYKILRHEKKFFLETAKGVPVIFFSDLDSLVTYYKINKMTATSQEYILVQPVSENVDEEMAEEDDDCYEDMDWDLDIEEDNITPFFQQQFHTIKSGSNDKEFMETLKDYIERNVVKDFQCVNQGTCKAPFVQKLLVTAADDLQESLDNYSRRLKIMHELFNIGRNDFPEESDEIENSHDMDSILKMLKHCKESIQNLEKKALEVFHDFQQPSQRDSRLMHDDSIDGGKVDSITHSKPKLVEEMIEEKPKGKEELTTSEFEVTVGPLRSKNVVKIDVKEGTVLITKSGNDKPDTYPIDQILQLVKSKSSKILKVKIGTGKDATAKSFNFSNYMSRELFCQTVQQVKIAHSKEPTNTELTVFVGTFNMGTSNVPGDISSWYKCIGSGKTNNSLADYVHIASDLYAFGTQESAYYEKEWANRLKNDLQKTYQREFKQIISSTLWGLRIVILIKAELMQQVTGIKQSSVKTGIANALGNKGAVAVSFNVGTTSFCFVNSHLTSGTERLKRRNQNYLDILRGLSLGQEPGFDITLAFHHVFWMGDLNYRLELEEKDIPMIIKQRMMGDLNSLLDYDQLLTEMGKKRVFVGFEESELQFPPTYKYMKGDRSMYDWKKEKRTEIRINVPSWCDRVLWRSYPGVSSLNTTYGCSDSIFTSDHSPVFATFKVDVVAPNSSKLEQSFDGNAMQLVFGWVEARIATRSSSKFVLTFKSNCLEKQVVSKPNSIDNCKRQQESLMRRSGTNDVAVHNSYPWWTKSDIFPLIPVLKDPYYLETQHLLIVVKGEDEQESYGECIISLKPFLNGKEQTVECQLTHFGLQSGTLLFTATMVVPKELNYEPSTEKDIYSLIKLVDDDPNKDSATERRAKTMDRSMYNKKDLKLVPLNVDPSSIQQVDPENRVVESSKLSVGDVLKRRSLGFDNFALRISVDKDPAHVAALPSSPVENIWESARDNTDRPPPPHLRVASIENEETPKLPPKLHFSRSTSLDDSQNKQPTKSITVSRSLPQQLKSSVDDIPVEDDDATPPVPKTRTKKKAKLDILNWLASIKCDRYYDLLVKNGYDDLSFFHELTIDDLKEIGIDKSVDRVQILMHAKALKPKKQSGLVKV